MIRTFLAMAALATPAAAQDLPSLFTVTDVARNDVLNIRSAPSARAEIVGSFAPNAMGVEVIAQSDDDRWGMVNTAESTGWTALRFLTEQPGQSFPPAAYTCLGTEPFWNFDVLDRSVTWSDFLIERANLQTDWTGTGMRMDRFGLRALGDQTLISATIRREICSDGMSDRTYGFTVDAIIDQPGEQRPLLVSGCCSLSY